MRTVNIEILKVGIWNGNEFSVDDLKDIEKSFRDLKLAGRVPVGIGHQRDDTREAEGWISGLHVKGDVLVATVEIINDELIDDIEGAKFRNVSVELLPDVKYKNVSHAWVLVGLAILGAVPPAVIGLQPLNEAIMQRLRGAAHGKLVAFAYGREPRAERQDEEGVRLRAENTKLQPRLIDEVFNRAIDSGRILPRDRESFTRRFGGKATVEDAVQWIASSPRPARSDNTKCRQDPKEQVFDRPDEELFARVIELQRKRKEESEPIDLIQATREVMRADPALARRYARMPSEIWPND